MIWNQGSCEDATPEQTKHVSDYKNNTKTELPCLYDAKKPSQHGRESTGNSQITVTFGDGNTGLEIREFNGAVTGLTFGPGGMSVGGKPIPIGRTINQAGMEDIIGNKKEKSESRCTAKSSVHDDVNEIKWDGITVTKTSNGMVLIEVLTKACVYVV